MWVDLRFAAHESFRETQKRAAPFVRLSGRVGHRNQWVVGTQRVRQVCARIFTLPLKPSVGRRSCANTAPTSFFAPNAA